MIDDLPFAKFHDVVTAKLREAVAATLSLEWEGGVETLFQEFCIELKRLNDDGGLILSSHGEEAVLYAYLDDGGDGIEFPQVTLSSLMLDCLELDHESDRESISARIGSVEASLAIVRAKLSEAIQAQS